MSVLCEEFYSDSAGYRKVRWPATDLYTGMFKRFFVSNVHDVNCRVCGQAIEQIKRKIKCKADRTAKILLPNISIRHN